MLNQLNKITFSEALRKVDKTYGVYSQLLVFGNTVDTFILAPKEDSLYNDIDIDFISEQIIAECEGSK